MNSPESFSNIPTPTEEEVTKVLKGIERATSLKDLKDNAGGLSLGEADEIIQIKKDLPESDVMVEEKPKPEMPAQERWHEQENFGFVAEMNKGIEEGSIRAENIFAENVKIEDRTNKNFHRQLVAFYTLKAIDLFRKNESEWLFEMRDITAVSIRIDESNPKVIRFDLEVNLKPNIVERYIRRFLGQKEEEIGQFAFCIDQKGEVRIA